MTRFFIFYALAILTVTSGFLLYNLTALTPEQYTNLTREHGPIEMLTAIGFALTACTAAIIAWKEKTQIWSLFAAFMAFAAARELDLHKAFTSDSILKSKFYLKSDAPWFEKTGGALFILLLIYCVIRLLPYTKQWVQNLLKFQSNALSIFLAMGILAAAKMLDSFARLFPFIADIHTNNRALFGLVEETFECTCIAFFAFVCLNYFVNRRDV